MDWYHSYLGKRKGQWRYTRHKIYAIHADVVDGVVSTWCYFDADSLDFTGVVRRMAGRYDDELEMFDGRWLIKKRYIDIQFIPRPIQASAFKGHR